MKRKYRKLDTGTLAVSLMEGGVGFAVGRLVGTGVGFAVGRLVGLAVGFVILLGGVFVFQKI